MKSFRVTFYLKATDATPATAENTTTETIKAWSEWNAQERMRAKLCQEYPSGHGGSAAVILRVDAGQ